MRKKTVLRLRNVAKERYAYFTWRSVKKVFNHIPRPKRELFLTMHKIQKA